MKQFLKICTLCFALHSSLISSLHAAHLHAREGEYASFVARDLQTISSGDAVLFDTKTALREIVYNSTTGVFTVTHEGTYSIAAAFPGDETVPPQNVNAFSIIVNDAAVASIPGNFTALQATIMTANPSIPATVLTGNTTAFFIHLATNSTISIENTSGTAITFAEAVAPPRYNAYITINRID